MDKIKIENITKTFNPHSRNKNMVLKNISFELPNKGLIAIYGKSGSGKTTLLNIIGGLEKPDRGNIYIDGEDVSKKMDKIRNQKIGFIFQNYYLESGYRISEIMQNSLHIAGIYDKAEIESRTKKVLELVGMERYKNKLGDALSGGQKQRVAIARALIKGSSIILADEPTGNLDASNTTRVMEILKSVSKTRLVVLVTHELSLIKKYADSYIKMIDGSLVNEPIQDDELMNLANDFVGKETSIAIDDKLDSSFKTNNDFQSHSKEKDILFAESKTKNSGKLFRFKSILKSRFINKEYKQVSLTSVFKQIFIVVMAIVMCFLTLTLFDSLRNNIAHKPYSGDSVYTNMDSYQEIRRLDNTLYDSIDFYEARYAKGIFSYNNLQSLPNINVEYIPKRIGSNKMVLENKLAYGRLPEKNEVLVTRSIVNRVKEEIRIKELEDDSSFALMLFEKKYRISGIVEENELVVYMNDVDYVNYLGIYNEIQLIDNTKLFYKSGFLDEKTGVTINHFTAEICLYEDGVLELENNQSIIEINRNSIYLMMNDTTQADYNIELANKTLLNSPEYVYIKDSYPMYVRQFKLTRSAMTTDIKIYVTVEALNDIFAYIAPNLDSLGSDSNYYFELKTTSKEQLIQLKKRLSERGIYQVKIQQLYDDMQEELIENTLSKLVIYFVVILLLYLLYYFIEKSGSVTRTKEYGVFRAIGVTKTNLLYKETINVIFSNILIYIATFVLVIGLLCLRYYVGNIEFIGFIGITMITFLISVVLMLFISLIPYLFVLYKTPTKILSSYDI